MLELSDEIFAFLTGQTAFTAVMDNKVFPIMALEGTATPFTTYRINEKTPLTKDGNALNFSLFFWFSPNEYKKMIAFTEIMEAIIKEKTNYEWVSSYPDFIEENFSYVGIINLNKD
ncbi:hypothetical protein B0A75_04715 [Flavobacterium oncorhynchi]|uniref:Uncharacterized protein n=1 Tax=Flavobacterium oncorhynchi TaxID=728056 RepID=A0A226I6H4_9FLAO|nr:hypothetical protein [Flavobacterium oncorhynchi]OXB01747.1 hypothetical protein B0A75_04715 [Flavobacterium oncorhynchi]